ncbi:MAG TPA: hypothetical protein VF989_01035 [Polyangiaceae bacterium]
MSGRGAAWTLAASTALALFCIGFPARADVSSWVFAGLGPSVQRDSEDVDHHQTTLQLESGLGAPPDWPVTVGGLFRIQTHFTEGTDLALLTRFATRSFTSGGWGPALDLGGFRRFWAGHSNGGVGSLVLGAPWGITLSLSGFYGDNGARGATLALGLDFARLTVHRTSGLDWFPNPRRPEQASGR